VSFEVVWSATAIKLLERIFDSIDDQEGLINTVTRINTELASVAAEAGESREPGRRILFKFPLVITYDVIERIRSVTIIEVGRMRR
jgi:plasmid stabilization system protein ParE